MAEPIAIHIPRENVNDESVTVVHWFFENGQAVDAGATLVELETSKTNFHIEAPAAGFIRYTHAAGAEIPIGGLLAYITESADTPLPLAPREAPAAAAVIAAPETFTVDESMSARPEASGVRFSREAQRLLEQRGLEGAALGLRGLVRAQDILRALGEAPAETGTYPGVEQPAPHPVIPSVGVPYTSEKLARSKRVEAKHLWSGLVNTLPSVVTIITPTRGLRAAVAKREEVHGNTAAIIAFETARLLRKYPRLNAFYAEGHAHLYDEVNLGIALDADKGLKVAVIRNADKKSIREIAGEIQELMVAYLNDELPLEALAGATFTITDLSGEGVFSFHPLINQGQSAILGIGAEFFPPGRWEGFFNLVLAFDHQLTEGRQAAQFLNDLKERLSGYEEALSGAAAPKTDRALVCDVCMTPVAELPPRAYMLQTVDAKGAPGLICSICAAGY